MEWGFDFLEIVIANGHIRMTVTDARAHEAYKVKVFKDGQHIYDADHFCYQHLFAYDKQCRYRFEVYVDGDPNQEEPFTEIKVRKFE